MSFQYVFEVLTRSSNLPAESPLLMARENGAWRSYRRSDCLRQIERYRQVLWQMGLRKGDCLVVIPGLASAEWLFLDLAAQQSGLIVAVAHETFEPKQLAYIIDETSAKACFLKDRAAKSRFFEEAAFEREIWKICVFGANAEPDSLGYQLTKVDSIEEEKQERVLTPINPRQLAFIVYTSGTTDVPRGVMLSHANIVSNLHGFLPLLPTAKITRALTFLPFSHMFERSLIYAYLALGITVYLPTERTHVPEALTEIKPHIFTAVPRILEKMYEQMLSFQSSRIGLIRVMTGWAIKMGERYKDRARFFPWQWIQIYVARYLVYRPLRKRLGGRLKAIVVGAAHLQPKLGKIFAVAGIKVREGYGLTEAAPVITVNRFQPGLNAFGTVGLPLHNVQVKIDRPDASGSGEILVKGPNIMLGYFRNPGATHEALTPDGWLKTGDIGKFVKKRFLVVTGRKKDLFKTSAGKYISPQSLENYFKKSPFIDQIMVVGLMRPYVTALVLPNFTLLEKWCRTKDIHWTSPQYMVLNIKVNQKLRAEIEELNADLPNFKRIRNFHLLHEEWSREKGQLSMTLKLVRHKLMQDFEREIEALY